MLGDNKRSTSRPGNCGEMPALRSGGIHVKTVFVIGAGPAGMFAAQKIAQGGYEVIILNRDIKPGGLAEYGIYPTKDKMKIGLRKQFAKVLSLPNVHYFGHVPVSRQAAEHGRSSARWED